MNRFDSERLLGAASYEVGEPHMANMKLDILNVTKDASLCSQHTQVEPEARTAE